MNNARMIEGVILLDIIYTINSKSYNVEGANILVAIDNQVVWRMVYGGLTIPNYFNQDSAAEASSVKQIIDQCNIHITIQKVKSYKKTTNLFL